MGWHLNSLASDSVIAIPGEAAGYRLIAKRGWGGFAEVWEAEAPGGFRVALRLVRSSPDRQATELRAIEIIRRIRHPHLLPIFGAWRVNGLLVVCMELAERSLWERFCGARAEGLLGIPRRELLGYLAGAASAVDYLNAPCHSVDGREDVGVEHRDLKPRNILLLGRCAKLGDFGMVRVLDGRPPRRARSWTLAYTAPESLSGKSARQSDQYGLAVTYCQMRGGRLPFRGNLAEVVAGHMLGTPDLSAVPEPERAVVLRALAKSPEDRWPDCRSFIEALVAESEHQPGDDLDRLEDETAGDRAGIRPLPDRSYDQPSGHDASDASEFLVIPAQDPVSRSDWEGESASDFQLWAPSEDDLPAHEPADAEGPSDFLVCGPSGDDWPARESSEFEALSDSRELPQWSDEAYGASGPPAGGESGESRRKVGGTRWSDLLVPFYIATCAAALAFLAFLPHAHRQALARRPGSSTIASRPSGPRTVLKPARAVQPREERHAARGSPAPTPRATRSVATVEKPERTGAEAGAAPSRTDRPSERRHVVAKPPAPRTEAPTLALKAPTALPERPAAEAVAAAPSRTDEPREERRAERKSPAPTPTATRSVATAERPERTGAEAGTAPSRTDRPSERRHVVAKPPAPRPEPPSLALKTQTAPPPAPADLARAAYERGRTHLARGSYGDSVAAFSEALRHDPAHGEAHFSRGMAHHLGGRYREALADYGEAIKRRPDDATAYLLRGRVHQALGTLDRALADLGAVLRLRPGDASAYAERGHLHHRTGEYDRALADYSEAIRLRPDDPTPYYRRGLVRYESGDPSGAIRDFDRVLSLAPRRPDAYLARSEAYARLHQFARAAADHDAFDRLTGGHPRVAPADASGPIH